MSGFNIKQFFVFFSLFLTFAVTGCLGTGANSGSEDELDASAAVEQEQPFYHSTYKEILLPHGLTMDKKETSFVKTQSFTGGNVRFTGSLEVDSLGQFFVNSMPKNGWKSVYSQQGSEVLQAYTKDHATCIIKITETSFKTTVDIYVSDVAAKY